MRYYIGLAALAILGIICSFHVALTSTEQGDGVKYASLGVLNVLMLIYWLRRIEEIHHEE